MNLVFLLVTRWWPVPGSTWNDNGVLQKKEEAAFGVSFYQSKIFSGCPIADVFSSLTCRIMSQVPC